MVKRSDILLEKYPAVFGTYCLNSKPRKHKSTCVGNKTNYSAVCLLKLVALGYQNTVQFRIIRAGTRKQESQTYNSQGISAPLVPPKHYKSQVLVLEVLLERQDPLICHNMRLNDHR